MADTTGLNPDFAPAVLQLIEASHGRIWINSGYRTEERQAQLYQAAVAKYGEPAAGNYVAPPGKSNHNFGLAVDLGGDLKLAAQLAPRFGLTFPMSWEPWHMEPLWARQARGAAYKDAMLPVPAGVTADPMDALGSIHTQINHFTQIIRGTPADQLDAQLQTTGTGTGAAPVTGTTKPGAVDAHALYQALKAQGVDPVHAAALVAIAGRESGYDPTAHNGNRATGDDSYGLFQINLLNGMHSQFSPQQLTTFDGSVQAAASLVKSGGLQPWGGYKGAAWSAGTNLDAAVSASGGEVTVDQLKALGN